MIMVNLQPHIRTMQIHIVGYKPVILNILNKLGMSDVLATTERTCEPNFRSMLQEHYIDIEDNDYLLNDFNRSKVWVHLYAEKAGYETEPTTNPTLDSITDTQAIHASITTETWAEPDPIWRSIIEEPVHVNHITVHPEDGTRLFNMTPSGDDRLSGSLIFADTEEHQKQIQYVEKVTKIAKNGINHLGIQGLIEIL